MKRAYSIGEVDRLVGNDMVCYRDFSVPREAYSFVCFDSTGAYANFETKNMLESNGWACEPSKTRKDEWFCTQVKMKSSLNISEAESLKLQGWVCIQEYDGTYQCFKEGGIMAQQVEQFARNLYRPLVQDLYRNLYRPMGISQRVLARRLFREPDRDLYRPLWRGDVSEQVSFGGGTILGLLMGVGLTLVMMRVMGKRVGDFVGEMDQATFLKLRDELKSELKGIVKGVWDNPKYEGFRAEIGRRYRGAWGE